RGVALRSASASRPDTTSAGCSAAIVTSPPSAPPGRRTGAAPVAAASSPSAIVAEEPVALDRSVTAAFTIRISSGGGSRNTLTSVSVTSTLPTLHVHGAGGAPSGGGAG